MTEGVVDGVGLQLLVARERRHLYVALLVPVEAVEQRVVLGLQLKVEFLQQVVIVGSDEHLHSQTLQFD